MFIWSVPRSSLPSQDDNNGKETYKFERGDQKVATIFSWQMPIKFQILFAQSGKVGCAICFDILFLPDGGIIRNKKSAVLGEKKLRVLFSLFLHLHIFQTSKNIVFQRQGRLVNTQKHFLSPPCLFVTSNKRFRFVSAIPPTLSFRAFLGRPLTNWRSLVSLVWLKVPQWNSRHQVRVCACKNQITGSPKKPPYCWTNQRRPQ